MHFPTATLLAAAALGPLAAAVPAVPTAWAPRVNAVAVQKSGGFKDMILTEIRTNTLANSNGTDDNRRISCASPLPTTDSAANSPSLPSISYSLLPLPKN